MGARSRVRRLAGVAAAVGSLVAGVALVGCTPRPTVGMGGRNHLGTGQLLGDPNRENFWLAISGPCASAEQGELIAAVSDANFTSTANPPSSSNSWATCTGGSTVVNDLHDPDGYVYGVSVPAGYSGGPLAVEAYDSGFCSASGGIDSGGPLTTTYTVRAPVAVGARPVTGAALASFERGSGVSCKQWSTLYTIESPQAGATYHVQVQSGPLPPQEPRQQGTNQFSLRVRQADAGFVPCSVDPIAADYDTACVDVHAVGWAGLYLNLANSIPTFPVARVAATDAGSVLQLSIWDPGEGSRSIGVMGPSGLLTAFDWEVVDRSGADVAPTGGWTGAVPAGGTLDVSGTGHPQPGPNRLSSSRYSDRLLRFRIPIPADGSGTGTWKLQYVVSSAPTDRTTIRADVLLPTVPEPSTTVPGP